MTNQEKEAIIKKAKDLGFENLANSCYWEYKLPFGLKSTLVLSLENYILGIAIVFQSFNAIRQVESPEDLENLFNAICPEKYRLPFG